jgi:hypothetical protein
MIRKTILFLLVPIFSFSQDTLFNKTMSEVTIRSTGKKESNVAVVNIVRNNVSVSDGISVEFIKKTPDRTVGDALKRVNGVTIQNDKFVLVRGLADRYNSAMLNKTILPSTEPDRRAFSFDIIPSNLIDNIIVTKSATPSLPGDFGGGVIQITTKEVGNNFFSLGLGSGFGTVSTFKKFKSVDYIQFPTAFPSTYTFRVGSNGDRRSYTKLMPSPEMNTRTSFPNINGNLAFGLKKDKWNLLFSATTRKSFSLNYTDRLDYQSSTELAYKYKDTSYSEVSSVNGLLNLTYLGENRYSWKTLVNHQVEQLYLTRNGENYDNVQDVRSNSSNAIVKTNINSQFDGKIKTIDFNFGYNLMLRDQPDYRVNPIAKSLGTNTPYTTAWRDTYRFWSIMDENSFNGSVNKDFGDIKIGGSYVKKIRNFQARIFRYDATDMLNEITNNTDRYTADFDLAGGYVSYDKMWGKIKLNGGLRTEYNLFNVGTSDFSGQKVNVDRNYLDFLPSVNLSYNLDKTKFRFSASKTLARPEFREVANFAYYDFVRNAQLLGNPNLEKSDIYNIDLKWEYYPKSGENISFGVFGKNFVKPIEQIVADGSVPSNLLLTYMNPNKAQVFGVEFELRKKISSWLDAYTNTTLVNSEVNVNGVKRQLQGQSNYVINGGLNFHKGKNTINISYNRVGDRISAVGFQGYPDIFENSRDVLDFVYLRKIEKGEIKFSVGDILSQPSKFYQKINNRDLIKTNNEQMVSIALNLNL